MVACLLVLQSTLLKLGVGLSVRALLLLHFVCAHAVCGRMRSGNSLVLYTTHVVCGRLALAFFFRLGCIVYFHRAVCILCVGGGIIV